MPHGQAASVLLSVPELLAAEAFSEHQILLLVRVTHLVVIIALACAQAGSHGVAVFATRAVTSAISHIYIKNS